MHLLAEDHSGGRGDAEWLESECLRCGPSTGVYKINH